MHALGTGLASIRMLALAAVAAGSLTMAHPVARAHAPDSDRYGELVVEAAARRDAGLHAEAAALLAEAYRARPEEERADEIGEDTVRAAMLDYDLAWSSSADLVLLQARIELLREFLEARQRAQDTARAHGARRPPEVPNDLFDDLLQLEATLEQENAARAHVTPSTDTQAEVPAPVDAPSTVGRDRVLLAVGGASLVGGIALIGAGAWDLAKVAQRSDERQRALDAEPRYSNDQRVAYAQTLDQWRTQWRRASAGLIATGVVLAVTGAGLGTWAILRIRKQRSTGTNTRLVPQLAPGLAGLALRGTFR